MVPLMLCFLQAIRQAQELGLHRETASDDPADHVEARRNVWEVSSLPIAGYLLSVSKQQNLGNIF